jgi:hypothetical protein
MVLGMAMLVLSSVDTVKAADTCHIGYHGPAKHHALHKHHRGGMPACHDGHCHH